MDKFLAQSAGGFKVEVPQQIQGLVDPGNFGSFGLKFIYAIIINVLFVGAIFLALGFILAGGFKWISSQGDPKEIDAARKTLTYSAIGLAVIFLSFFFVNVMSCFLGITLLIKACR